MALCNCANRRIDRRVSNILLFQSIQQTPTGNASGCLLYAHLSKNKPTGIRAGGLLRMYEDYARRNPLPKISLELVISIKAWGSTPLRYRRRATAWARLSAVSTTHLS